MFTQKGIFRLFSDPKKYDKDYSEERQKLESIIRKDDLAKEKGRD